MDAPTPTSLQHEVGKQHPFDAPEQEAYLNLMRAHAVLSRAFAGLFKEHGLSDAQYNVLRIVSSAGKEGLRTETIGARMVAQDPDTTRLVDRLEKAGLVTRKPAPEDRRCVVVAATDAGLLKLRELNDKVFGMHRAQLGHMTASDLNQLSRLLFRARHPHKGGDAVNQVEES